LGQYILQKTAFYLVAYRHCYLTNFKKDTQPHYSAGILSLTHDDKFSIFLSTEREFLSIQFQQLKCPPAINIKKYQKVIRNLSLTFHFISDKGICRYRKIHKDSETKGAVFC